MITIATTSGETKVQTVPKELDLIVKESQVVQQDQPVTLNLMLVVLDKLKQKLSYKIQLVSMDT
jgi:hypothetical protein